MIFIRISNERLLCLLSIETTSIKNELSPLYYQQNIKVDFKKCP